MTARTLVVIPTYDECDNIVAVLEAVFAAADVDVLIVDDASPDGTGALADAYAGGEARVQVMHRPAKTGLGSAYRSGFAWGLERGYAVLVEMDADLSHDPGRLPALIAATDAADVAIGSRYVRDGGVDNWPWYRRVLSRGGNVYARLVTGMPLADATSGYRAIRREVFEALGLGSIGSDGYAFQLEVALRCWRAGFKIVEVPITFVERRAGASKLSRRIVLEAMWRVLVWGLKGPRRAGDPHPRSVITITAGANRRDLAVG